ncbi:hypothetical protein BN890_15340 [Bacteroides xylanisolvens SD CC 1b]|uniref:Uncharacterized protein n=1 Tax=Bacteroides xylanisolvens SD CC 1b TaxID=702447 RepID=W6PIT9_9BACE|nr:hypothetical protein BN891_37280 [Bacteroides xylanisolvens SD CC 2a]CDM03960.1 hypothetical protein BN890_15340 [Bacteroides xylanisolvens SD CC 1b]
MFNGKHIYTFYEKPFFKSTKIDKKINDITLLLYFGNNKDGKNEKYP